MSKELLGLLSHDVDPVIDTTLGYTDASLGNIATRLLQNLDPLTLSAVQSLAEQDMQHVGVFPVYTYDLINGVDINDPARNTTANELAIEEIDKISRWFRLVADSEIMPLLLTYPREESSDYDKQRCWFAVPASRVRTMSPAFHAPPFELMRQHLKAPADPRSEFMKSQYAVFASSMAIASTGAYD